MHVLIIYQNTNIFNPAYASLIDIGFYNNRGIVTTDFKNSIAIIEHIKK